MPLPEGWDEGAAIEACPVGTWEGSVWRIHKRRYAATDPGGARKVSGRYNRGLDRFPEAESFPALYLATGPEVCLGEVYRHVTPKLLPSLNDYRLSELFVRVEAVLDRRDPAPLELRFKISYMTPTTRPRRQSGLQPSQSGWKGYSSPRRRASATT